MALLALAGCGGSGGPLATSQPLYLALGGEDAARADATLQQALETTPSGEGVTWANDGSGARGGVMPLRTFRAGGSYCREFLEAIAFDGRRERVRLTGCRSDDGVWRPR